MAAYPRPPRPGSMSDSEACDADLGWPMQGAGEFWVTGYTRSTYFFRFMTFGRYERPLHRGCWLEPPHLYSCSDIDSHWAASLQQWRAIQYSTGDKESIMSRNDFRRTARPLPGALDAGKTAGTELVAGELQCVSGGGDPWVPPYFGSYDQLVKELLGNPFLGSGGGGKLHKAYLDE